MSRMGTAVLAFIGLTAIAFMLVGCNGFFVSPNSLRQLRRQPAGCGSYLWGFLRSNTLGQWAKRQ